MLGAAKADLNIWCNASDIGLGFYCPADKVAFVLEHEDDTNVFECS